MDVCCLRQAPAAFNPGRPLKPLLTYFYSDQGKLSTAPAAVCLRKSLSVWPLEELFSVFGSVE